MRQINYTIASHHRIKCLIEKPGIQGEWKLWNEAQGFKNMVILNAEINDQGMIKGKPP
jgi:hypothetical protein